MPLAAWVKVESRAVISRRIHLPRLGGGGDQHRLGTGARLTQLVPGARDGGRASRALIAIELGIDLSLLHHDVIPVSVELIGNDHAEGRLDALADFRGFGIDGDGVVRGDADEGVHRLVLLTWSWPSAVSAANAWSPNRKPSTKPAAPAPASLKKLRRPMANEELADGMALTSRVSAAK